MQDGPEGQQGADQPGSGDGPVVKLELPIRGEVLQIVYTLFHGPFDGRTAKVIGKFREFVARERTERFCPAAGKDPRQQQEEQEYPVTYPDVWRTRVHRLSLLPIS